MKQKTMHLLPLKHQTMPARAARNHFIMLCICKQFSVCNNVLISSYFPTTGLILPEETRFLQSFCQHSGVELNLIYFGYKYCCCDHLLLLSHDRCQLTQADPQLLYTCTPVHQYTLTCTVNIVQNCHNDRK